MGLFDVFKKKETINSPKAINSQQAQFQKVYSLVSKEKFGVCYNYVVSRVLNATTYQSTSTLNAEGAAVLEERKIRENEKIDENVDNIVSIDDVKKITDGLFVENVRPEIVCKKIIAAFKQIGAQNQIKLQLIDEFCKEIKKMTDTFDEAFMRCVNINEGSHKTVRTMSNQAYSERTSTGLGFGILTSSIGTAALYTVMNAHEHKRQLNAQNAQINSSVNAMNRGSGEVLYTSVMELYDAYQKDMNGILISFQEILENKDKLQEAEEKLMPKNRTTISSNMILSASVILSALYKIGKPCSEIELMEIEECRKYSHQNIAATTKRMHDLGVLGKDIKDKIRYFYPIPDSFEEAMKMMGITEKAIEDAKSQSPKGNNTLLDLNDEELVVQMCNCPDCKKSVSVHAVACPYCGYPVKKNFYTNLYNKEPLEGEEGKMAPKSQCIVKLWILTQYFDMLVTELPRTADKISTWVTKNARILNCITENNVAELSKSPESDYKKINRFLRHEAELNRYRRNK